MTKRNLLALGFLLIISSASSQTFDGLPGCRTTRLELVFMVDGSSSVSEYDFKIVKQWIRNMTLNFDISPATTRVAVIQYSSYPRIEFGLYSYSDAVGVVRGVDNMNLMSGSTMTGRALRYAIERVFAYSRDGAAKVVVLLSDGRSQDQVTRAAETLHSSGIATFAVGIGEMTSSARMRELRQITSGPPEYDDNIFMVEDFSSIGQIQRQLVNAVCEQTVQECPTAKHDLTFVIDVSSSIGYEDFKKVKEWMKKIVGAFDIGPNHTRVAVVMFSTYVQEVCNFKAFLTKEQVLNAIDMMEYVMGDTHTEIALLYMLDNIYTETNGDRPNVPDMAIVMTDGKAQEFEQVVRAANRVHQTGITVYAVGVGDSYREEEVNAIASDPDEVFVIKALNFDIIELKRRGLVKNICFELVQKCPAVHAEIVFLIDGSSSIGSRNFEKIKQWMKSIVDAFQVGPYYARVGVVQFTETPYLEFGLDEYHSTQATLQAIQNIRYRRGSTNIKRAIDFTLSRVFSATRLSTSKVLIILSDGESHDNVSAGAERARQSGVHTLMFGVDNPQPKQLRNIVSQTDSVFRADGFDMIQRLESQLISLICVQAEPLCASQEVDLHFLVDSSDSIGVANLEIIKAWMINIVNSFDVGKYTTRVAVTQYSNIVKPEFNLIEYDTKREVDYAINKLKLLGGSTMTSPALDYIRRKGFSTENGGRQYAPKMLIVVSDGRSGDHFEEAARRMHESGIYVFSIGAGFALRKPMEIIGSRPVVPHVQEPSSFDGINRYRKELVDEICRYARTECPEAEMDLIFLVDGSTSVGRRDFETTKEWIISFVRQFEIGEYNTKIGLVQYSSNVEIEIDIGAYESKEDLIRAIMQVEFEGGSTNTGAALNFIRSIGFSATHGSRKDVPKVLIILTDGDARDQVTMAAKRLINDGVEVYAIGIGQANVGQLNAATSDPFTANIYHVQNYRAIKAIQSGLVRRVCAKIQPDCGKTATDLMFLVDGSTSVGAGDWNVIKHFVKNVTRRFKLSDDYVRVGVVQYSTYPVTSVEMGNYNSKIDLQGALSRMNFRTGNTYTARALRYVLRSYQNAPPRPNVEEKKLLIIITDGQAQDKRRITAAVSELHNRGWRIFAIGIGDADLSELANLASNPDHDHVFYANNFASTRLFQGRLTRLICGDSRYEAPHEATTSAPTSTTTTTVADNVTETSLRTLRFSQAHRYYLRNLRAFQERSRRIRTKLSGRNQESRSRSYLFNLRQSNRLISSSTTLSGANTINSLNQSWPVMWRNGKKVNGIDLLYELNVRANAASSKPLHKYTSGSNIDSVAFRIEQGKIPALTIKELLNNGLPKTFSLVSVFRMPGKTPKDIWTLMSITAPSGVTMLAISFNGYDKTMYITRSSSPFLNAQSTTLRGPLVASLFNHSYHKLEVIVENDRITIFINCKQLPDRVDYESPITNDDEYIASFVISQREKTIVDVQNMVLLCGAREPEQCCEIPDAKCSPPPSELKCGCLPEMKSSEVRLAEEAEMKRIATEIATNIFEEKMNEVFRAFLIQPDLYIRPRTIRIIKDKLLG